ncbi:amino acid racemase [Thalassomonas viridans]|uniref:Amino acid racemase n=2 Tax=Thalassomonas viridans TaxID=137584 RepID=A0AAE9Z7F2_9GAMM|nr:amino acid racemase [Thalassomonas viridans]
MTKHIGIVGCSAEGAALCYKTICTESPDILGAHAHPEVSMHTHSLADYVKCLDDNNLAGIGELMLSSAAKLKQQGADFVICPDNTIHQAFDYVKSRSPLPWLHIAEVVVASAKARGFRRLGILGTRWLVESEVYPEKIESSGLGWQRPEAAETAEIGRIIMEELVYGIFKPESVAYFQQVIKGLKDKGCDAVILGCTEIPLIINDDNSVLPTLNSNRLLALAAIAEATGGQPSI